MKADYSSGGPQQFFELPDGYGERYYKELIPGTEFHQFSERDDSGVLIRIAIEACNFIKNYITRAGDRLIYDEGFVSMGNLLVPAGLLRSIDTPYDSWQEFYKTDDNRLPVYVDGMTIKRDEEGRVVSCTGQEQSWHYGFHGQHLIEIKGPDIYRHILRDESGRPMQYTTSRNFTRHIRYDSAGHSLPPLALPGNFCIDEEGRLRAILNGDKSIAYVFLWDGYNCLARIAGNPEQPDSQIDTVYSLDMTGTPVRLITRSHSTRVPRDAYGENLLRHHCHPGLYGGTQYKAQVWFRSRRVDCATASFNAPDPLHGGKQDPRRSMGYDGGLLVETPKAGPYAVCQYDPITYLDPTGEIAWYYVISTLTWAFPNNILSWIGLEATANFWGTFFTGSWSDWADGEHWKSERLDIGGIQRQSFFAPNPGGAFTTQHLIWARHDYIDSKRRATVFDPGGAYQPRLYNSMLRVAPSNGSTFLLNGQQQIGNITQPNDQLWVRSGGPASEVAPGQRVPFFAQGGLHFPFRSDDTPGPQAATCTEISPTSSVGVGSLDNHTTLELPNTLSLSQGDLLLLKNSSNVIDIVPVASTLADGRNQIARLSTAPGFTDTSAIAVTALQASSWTEILQNSGMPAANYLDAASTTNAWQIDDALQLEEGGTLYAGQITGFETQLDIDEALSGTPATPLSLFSLTVNSGSSFNARINSATEVEFTSGTTPSAGEFLLLTDGTNSLAVVVGDGTGAVRSVDRNLGPLSGPDINWHSAARGIDLGAQTAAIVSSVLTYTPASLALMPATGDHLVIDFGPAGALTTQLRTVTALDYHAITINTSSPAPPANSSFNVSRFPIGLSFSDRRLSQSLALALSQGNVSGAVALQLYQLSSDVIGGSNFVEGNLTVSGNSAARPWLSLSRAVLTPNQPVVVNTTGSAANTEVLVVATVQLDIYLNYPLSTSNTNLEVVAMAAGGFSFDSQTLSTSQVVVSPVVATTGSVMADMPSFAAGECIEITDPASGATIGQYRISAVPEGTVLDLEGGPPLPGAGTAVTVQLLSVVPSGSGTSRMGINGTTVFANSNDESHVLRCDVWNRDAFTDGSYIGVVDGSRTLPFQTRPLLESVPVSVVAANSIDLDTSILSSSIAVDDHVLMSWLDGGVEQVQTFAVNAISGNTHDLTPLATGTPLTLSASATEALIGIFINNAMHDVTVPVNNQVDLSPSSFGGVAVPLPSFNIDDSVIVCWRNSSSKRRAQEFRVSNLLGTVLTLTQNNSSPRINLTPTDTDVSIAHVPLLNVEFTTTPVTASPMDILELTPVNTDFVASFLRETDQSLLMNNSATLTSPSSNAIIVVPLMETGAAQAGILSSGTGKVPEDPENTAHGEHDRHQMLAEHELRHTEQYLWWGPMFLTMVPLWPVELGLELGTDIELPDYGPFQQGQLEILAGTGAMKITFDAGTAGFAVDQEVQVNQGSHNVNRTLQAAADGDTGFRILRVSEFSKGLVNVRSINSFPDWYRVLHGSFFRTLTIGGLVQLAASMTHGLFFQIVGRFFYLIYRSIQTACCDDRKQALVGADQTQVRLSNPAERNDLSNFELLMIQEPGNFGNAVFSGIDTVVRSRAGDIGEDGVITLSAPLPWVEDTTVNIGPYESRTPGQMLDWKKYYPAEVQADNFNRLRLLPIGDDSLNLAPFDRLRVIAESEFYGMFSNIRTVLSVSGDTVEVDEPVTGSGTADTELTVRVAKIGTEDPFDFLDTVGVDELTGGGWLRWASDPYGQLHAATSPNPGSFGDIIGRVGKTIMGTKAWTNPIILTSRYFAEALTKSLHNVSLEQDASEQSGDLYTPIGRICGEANVDDSNVTMTVGDIARFWYFGFEFSNSQNSLPASGAVGTGTDPGFRMDDPGNHIRRDQIIYPQQTAEAGAAAGVVNFGAQSTSVANSPGLDLADEFWQKQFNNPNEVSTTTPDRRMVPNDLGLVPQSAQLQLSSAVYLAFTRATSASSHRATMDDGIDGGANGRDAHDEESQRLFYNITVNDVVANFNNIAVAEGGSINLLRAQQVNVSVSDEGTKQYALRVMQPLTGAVVRASDSPNKTLNAQDPFAAGPGPFSEPFQLCRWHDMDDSSNRFRAGGLSQHNMHLPRDVFIPVRKLTVNVMEFPPVLTSMPTRLDFGMYPATPITLPALQPGSRLFFPVAANILTASQTLNYLVPPAPDITVIPARGFTDVTATAPQQVRDFLGDGLLYELALADDAIAEEKSSISVVFNVGDTALAAAITMILDIEGHFLARDTGALAASGYQLSLGSSAVLECVELDGSTVVNPDGTDVQFSLRDGTAVPQITVSGSPQDELTFSASGNQLTISVNSAANPALDSGFRRLLIADAGGTLKAARTIQLVP